MSGGKRASEKKSCGHARRVQIRLGLSDIIALRTESCLVYRGLDFGVGVRVVEGMTSSGMPEV
jgi:hypothetical protein